VVFTFLNDKIQQLLDVFFLAVGTVIRIFKKTQPNFDLVAPDSVGGIDEFLNNYAIERYVVLWRVTLARKVLLSGLAREFPLGLGCVMVGFMNGNKYNDFK
jgi:hypothetical protein